MQAAPVAVDVHSPSSLAFLRLRAVARLLGLDVSIAGSCLSLALDTSASLPEPPWSSGEIIHADHIMLGRPVPGGLACPMIFGDWHAPDVRRYGHIALACFILPLPSRHLLAPLLGETAAGLATLNSLEPEELLERIEDLHAAGQTVLGLSPLEFVWRSIPVIAPGLRTQNPRYRLVLDRDTGFAHALHEAYWRVVNRARRLSRLVELNAPLVITQTERRLVLEGVDELLMNVDLDDPRAYAPSDEAVPVRAFDALSLFFADLGGKLVEMGERNVLAHPEGKLWIAKAAEIGRGQGGDEPRLAALWRLAADRPADPFTDELRAEWGALESSR